MSYLGRGQQPSQEERMMQEIMFKMMMGVTKTCFSECVTRFSDDKLSPNEIDCIKKCSGRQADAFQSMN